MKKLTLKIGLIISLIIALQLMLIKLFPYGGEVSGFLYLPGMAILILLSVIIIMVINRLSENNKIKVFGAVAVIFFCTMVSLKYLYGKEEPIYQIKQGISYLKNPEEIGYKNLFGLNYQENSINVSAAIARYQNCLPEFGFRVTYCCDPFEEFYIKKSDNTYYSSRGEIIMNDSLNLKESLVLRDRYLSHNFELEISLKELKEKETIRKTVKFDDREINITFSKSKLEPKKGFSKIYFILFNKLLKKENCE